MTIPGERAVGSRAEVDFHAVAMAWQLDLSGTAEVGSLAPAESLDLGECRWSPFRASSAGSGRAAEAYQSRGQADRSRGVWLDPANGATPFAELAARWLASNPPESSPAGA